MKLFSILMLGIFLCTGFAVFGQEEDSCNLYFDKKECLSEGKDKGCVWLHAKDVCKSKSAIANDKKIEIEKNRAKKNKK